MCILQTRTYWKVGTLWDWNFKFLECKNKIYQRIELKVDEKNDIIRLLMFTSKVIVIRMSKMAHLMYFLLIPSLGKIYKCIWNILFGPFTKYYALWSSNLPLANCQYLKIQNFTSPLLNQYFFLFLIFLPTISHGQLRPKPIKHTIFCKNSMRSSTFT